MSENKAPKIKTAYELAMERLEQKSGRTAALSEEQKKALAEVDAQVRARLAEVEILWDQKLAAARAQGNEEEVVQLSEQRQTEIRRARDRGEAEKEKIRAGK